MKSHTPQSSKAVLAQMVLPNQTNPGGKIHGGEIMKMMDSAAGVAAQKYARSNVVTARVDELIFHKPVTIGQLVTCQAQVIYTGNTSMEVFVMVEVEDLIDEQESFIAQTAFFTMVSLDANGRPQKVPPIEIDPEDAYSCKLYEEGKKRHEIIHRRKNENLRGVKSFREV